MTKANISNGVATTSYSIPLDKQAGDYNVSTSFAETDNYKSATQTSLLKVRNPTTVTVQSVVADIGEAVTLSATIKSGNNNITSGQVQFYINKNPASISGYGTPIGVPVTVSNGSASVSFTPSSENTSIDANTITAVYLGNSTYIAAENTGILDIRDAFGITITPVVASKGETISIPITLTLTGASAGTLSDIEAILNIKDGDTVLESYATDLTESASIERFIGGGTVSLTLANNIAAKQYTIEVLTSANDDYEAVLATSTLTVKRETTVQAINVSANQNGTVNIGGKVVDEFGANVTTGSIRVTLPDSSQVTLQIGNSEWNTTSFQVSSAAVDGSNINYSVQYVGTGTTYEDSSAATGTIHVRKTTTITVADVTGAVGDTVSITANIKDSSNQPVPNGEIEFTISNQ